MSLTATIQDSPTRTRSVDRPLRIALVHVADSGGGAEESVLTLHRSLLEASHESRLFVGTKLTHEPHVIEIPRARPIPGLLRVTRSLENRLGWQALYAPWFRALHRLIGDVDVVHIHTLWGGQFGYADLTGIVRLARRYPTVLTLRDGWMLTGHCACPYGCDRWKTGCGNCPDLIRAPAVPRDATRFNWRRKRNAIRRAPLHVTTVSTWLRDQVRQSPIFAGKPVHVVHNSIDERVFTPASKGLARKSLGLPLDAFVVLLAGQAIEGIREGIAQEAIEALNRLAVGQVSNLPPNPSRAMARSETCPTTNHRITALLVGHSAPLVARTLKTPSVVLPFQTTPQAMANCYRAADLTIVPSAFETFGRVAAESLFCGTPVLAFATGGLRDIVDEDSGWLVPAGDANALATTLQSLLRDPNEITRKVQQCVQSARTRYSRECIRDDYVAVYGDAIRQREAGGNRSCLCGFRP